MQVVFRRSRGEAGISAVFSSTVLLLTCTWASPWLVWLVTVRARMCSAPGTAILTLLPSHPQGPGEVTRLQDTRCTLLQCRRTAGGRVQNPTPSAAGSRSRLCSLHFNSHLKGVFIILITQTSHQPSLVDNIAIKATETELFQPEREHRNTAAAFHKPPIKRLPSPVESSLAVESAFVV